MFEKTVSFAGDVFVPKLQRTLLQLAPRTGSTMPASAHLLLDTHLFVYPWEDGSTVGFRPVQLAAQTINTHTEPALECIVSVQNGLSCVLTIARTFTHSEKHTAVKAPLDMEANIALLFSISPQAIAVGALGFLQRLLKSWG